MLEKRVGFLGSGQMARALARGFVHAGLLTPEQISAYDLSAGALNEFQMLAGGATACGSNREVAEASDILFVAVKPHFVRDVLQDIAEVADGKTDRLDRRWRYPGPVSRRVARLGAADPRDAQHTLPGGP